MIGKGVYAVKLDTDAGQIQGARASRRNEAKREQIFCSIQLAT